MCLAARVALLLDTTSVRIWQLSLALGPFAIFLDEWMAISFPSIGEPLVHFRAHIVCCYRVVLVCDMFIADLWCYETSSPYLLVAWARKGRLLLQGS